MAVQPDTAVHFSLDSAGGLGRRLHPVIENFIVMLNYELAKGKRRDKVS